MSGTVGAHQVSNFTTPTNGTVNNATDVTTNDNALGTALNAHDNDATIHVPQGAFSARPAAGNAGTYYFASDTRQLFWDTGSAWAELTAGAMARKAYVVTDPQYGGGADPTGVADSSAAFTAADAAAQAGGGFVFIPAGTYILAGITVTAGAWIGAGQSVTTLKHKANVAAGAAMLTFAGSFTLHDLTVDGNRSNQANRARTLLHTGGFNAVVLIWRVTFNSCSINALKMTSVTGSVAVCDCEFSDMGPSIGTALNQEANAIYGSGLVSGRVLVDGCRFINGTPADVTQAPTAILLTGASTSSTCAVAVRACHFENYGNQVNTTGVIDIYEFCSQVDVSHNTIRAPHYSGIKLDNSNAIVVAGNTVCDVTTAHVGPLILVSLNARARGASWSSAVITGNIVRNATAHRGFAYDLTSDASPSVGAPWSFVGNLADQVYGGVRFYGLKDVVASGNVVRGATAAVDTFPSLLLQQCQGLVNWVGCEISGGAASGIRIQDDSSQARVSIADSLFRSNTGAHVKFDDTTTASTILFLAVRGCDFSGSVSPISVNRATLLVLRGNQSDSSSLTKTSVAAEQGQGTNSWDKQITQLLTGTLSTAVSVAAGASGTFTVTVTGAAVGDFVLGVSHANNSFVGALVMTGQVTGANTVTVTVNNLSAGALSLSLGNMIALVAKAS